MALAANPSLTRRLNIAVAVATTGRAKLLRDTVPVMLGMERAPDRVILVGASPADVDGLRALDPKVEVLVANRGLPRQRNAALQATERDCDAIVFFDDDFLPTRDYLSQVETIFASDPGIAAVTGVLEGDGVNLGGYDMEIAKTLLRAADAREAARDGTMWDINHVYGCNMALRLPAAAEVGFDERLPLYAWQEDRDFSRRLNQHGRIVRSKALSGVHLGVTQGRSPGVKLGYSQVANPLYLLRKGTMRPLETAGLVSSNIAANLTKCWKPEPWIDRPGRLRGNMLAIVDMLRGRAHPERILEL